MNVGYDCWVISTIVCILSRLCKSADIETKLASTSNYVVRASMCVHKIKLAAVNAELPYR